MKYLRVKKWATFQHYKTRSAPPWIKLYRDLLNDYEFNQLSELARGRLMRVWLLAASDEGRIPDDPRWVAAKIGARSIDLDELVARGFLEECYQSASNLLEPTEQNRTEKKRAENYRTVENGNGHYEIPEHDLDKLLSALRDKDDKTEGALRRLSVRLRLQPADFAEALEAARSKSAISPTAVAVAVLKTRKEAK